MTAKIEQYDLAYGPLRQTLSLALRGTRVAFACQVPNPVIGVFWPRTKRVVEFNPASGNAVYIEGIGSNPWLASYSVAMDSNRDVWISCNYRHGPQTGIVPGLARLKMTPTQVTGRFWQLPEEFTKPYDLWIDGQDRVWFTVWSESWTFPSPLMSIGRLHPGVGELKGWKVMDGLDPVFLGIAGASDASEVWFTRNQPSALYRLHVATDRVEEFSHPMVNELQDVVVDPAGDPWFGADDGFIGTVSRRRSGAQATVRHNVWSIEGHGEDLARTVVHAARRRPYVTPVLATVEPEQIFDPFVRWQPPGLTTGRQRGLFLEGDRLWFTDIARNRLGVMLA